MTKYVEKTLVLQEGNSSATPPVPAVTVHMAPSGIANNSFGFQDPEQRGSLAINASASTRVSAGYRRYSLRLAIPTEGVQLLLGTDGQDGDGNTIALGNPSTKVTLVDITIRLDTELNQTERLAVAHAVESAFASITDTNGVPVGLFSSIMYDGQGIW